MNRHNSLIALSAKYLLPPPCTVDSKIQISHVKHVLNVLVIMLIILSFNEAWFDWRFPVVELITILAGRWLLNSYITNDTINIVSAILLWTISLIASYSAWNYDGLFDPSLVILPCVLVFANLLSGRLTVISLMFFMIAIFYSFAFSHETGFIDNSLLSDSSIWKRANTLTIILLIYFIGVNMICHLISQLNHVIIRRETKMKEANIISNNLISFDILTKLPNENLCRRKLPKVLRTHARLNLMTAFMTLDFDNFKWINSSFGHLIGDRLICYLSERLQRLTGEQIKIFRTAGNEFIFIMPATDYDEITEFANQLAIAIARPALVDGYDIEITGKIGISIAPNDGDEYEILRQKSHLALAYLKEDKSDTFQFYDEEMASYADKRAKMLQDLRKAIDNQEFEIYYQPKINLHNETVVGAEALLRWNKPGEGVMSPDKFMSTAEESGLIQEIGKWVTIRACYDCKAWHELGFENISVAVNLSQVQFKRGNLPAIIESALTNAELAPEFLELEITESLFIDDGHSVNQQIRQIARSGVAIAIDDFGTGYSNLNYLNKFHASSLKIDMSFVKSMLNSETQKHIVKAIIEMSKVMCLQNTAEGIEDKATFIKLRDMGCHYAQGYYWAKPLPQKQYIHWMTKFKERNGKHQPS